jgi:LPS-assembly lipoprotein
MNRRQVLVLGFAASGLTLLQACGFKLRGTQTFAFDTIAVNPSSGGAVAAELRKALGDRLFVGTASTASSGSSASTAQAQVTLDILQELRERAVAAVNAAGQVRELQLRIRVKFRLRNANGKDLIEETEILQQRDISFNESAVLAKEVEESLLYKNMQSDIVQQLMRRLAAVKSIT